ncbi:dTDP-4-dehydrorhamnose reductase [Aquitalea aquatica]|uniref:dTDP-4-dehydrorhamnose reductase n=1 Tax=Aquitalea aquatica TaxID=3044273 RepID=A0A838Y494_9NEIS|nr:dTDP-4-dehydrorhamnose reductase [Aquitalea magnusonii]MBA4708162.1 dTDP-4-dehydrorhamnose reductase [Aquitalea magnusonii]
MSRILITGINGQLGFELRRSLAMLGKCICLDRQQLDLSRPADIAAVLDQYQPDIIVNPAAYTAVDKAESDDELAHAVNAAAPAAMAGWTGAKNALLLHYSTDYVFDGDKAMPYEEDDATSPQSVYGRSKCQGEQAIRASGADHIILRTSWVVGAHGSNFLKTIMRLARERDSLNVVADQIGAPTPAALIADVTAHIIKQWQTGKDKQLLGTYHLSSSGSTSWHGYTEYLLALAERYGVALQLKPENLHAIPSSAYPTPAKRPGNSRLNCSKIEHNFSLTMPAWQDGVEQVFQQIFNS